MREFKIEGRAQGTTYAVNYFATDSLVSRSQIDSILNVIDLSMSLYRPNSTINQFNSNPAANVKVDQHMLAVLNRSFQINKETDGLFDITIQPLMRFWGFFRAHDNDVAPDTAKINDILKGTTGMDKIRLKGNILSKANHKVELDLNGIAQGYTVDVIADFMEANGIESYLAELGGEIRVKGPKPDGKDFKIGIERPPTVDLTQNGLSHVLTLREGAITTSGDYRKYIVFDGKKYGHIINPKTGYPSKGEIVSVTIYAKKAIDADGYDNALMLMPVSSALAFVAAKKDLEAYIIYKKPDGTLADTLTSGFRKLILN